MGLLQPHNEKEKYRRNALALSIIPYNSEVMSKEKYDPSSYKRWEEHQRTNSELPTNDVAASVAGTFSGNDMASDTKCTFEELISSTVKQYHPHEKVKRAKVASAPEATEVIIAKDSSDRMKEIHDTKTTKKKRPRSLPKY
ncbi:hypothetical protein JTB14_022329 [Gonioctena quinquepunctata]|nr:hypothetical protein JTB14_022329 [Gonioctena quinquepunctata]